jgi:hypothetical protein
MSVLLSISIKCIHNVADGRRRRRRRGKLSRRAPLDMFI